MSVPHHRILFGARGWAHPGWVSAFYPEDLPEDWRLSYYANAHRVVLVSADLLHPGAADIVHWGEDVDAGFRFLFECVVEATAAQHVSQIQAFLARIAPLAGHCAGVYVRRTDPARPWNLGDLDAVLSVLAPVYPLSVEADPMACAQGTPLDDVLVRHDVGMCWHGPPAPAGLARGRLALTMLDAPVANLRVLRTIVETGLAAGGDTRESVLIVSGSLPDRQTLEHAATLCELL